MDNNQMNNPNGQYNQPVNQPNPYGDINNQPYQPQYGNMNGQSYQPEMNQYQQPYQPDMNPYQQPYQPGMNQYQQPYQPEMNQYQQPYQPDMNQYQQSYQPGMNQYQQPYQPGMDQYQQSYQPQMNQQYAPQPPVEEPNNDEVNKPLAKKQFSKYGLRLAIFGVVAMIIEYAISYGLIFIMGSESATDIIKAPWFSFVLTILAMHVFGLSFMVLSTLSMDKVTIEKKKMKFGQFICAIFMCAGMVGVGAIIGTIINAIILAPFGGNANTDTSGLVNIMMNSNPILRVVTVAVLAPIVEELVFRKLFIDRVVKYGEWVAILSSGVFFGLFHGNFQQAIFATFIGMFFAFIYVRTGQIWYTIGLHMVINFTTSVFTMFFISLVDLDKVMEMSAMDPTSAEAQKILLEILPGFTLYLLWLCFLGLCMLVGLILLLVNRKKFFLKKQPDQVMVKPVANAWASAGVIIFFVYNIIQFILAIVTALQ